MIKINSIIPYFIIVVMSIIIYEYITNGPEIIEVPVEIKVPVPSIEHSYDTVYIPDPVVKYSLDSLTRVNRQLAIENDSLIDLFSVSGDSIKYELYKESIAIREYKEEFKDTFQTINVETTTRGEILKQSVSYKTNPFNITVDTLITMETRTNKRLLMGELEIGYGVFNDQQLIIKPGISLITNSNSFGISIDSEGRGWAKFGIKF